jgi:uncharacterized repeat protein (TIGR03803 family)
MRTFQHSLVTGGALLTAFLIFNGHIAAQSPPPALTTLYSFAGGSDGFIPEALAVGSGPNGPILYGVADGGPLDFGMVFSLTPPAAPLGVWNKTVLYDFTGGTSDGFFPNGLLVGGEPGGRPVLYGTTVAGGANSAGIVFSLTPATAAGGPWTEAVLYNFASGLSPTPGLAMGGGGVFYGTTYQGGSSDLGTVYSLTPPASPNAAWTQTEIYSFTGSRNDGSSPLAGVVIGEGPRGYPVLYGTTSAGGAYGGGTVFALTPPAAAGALWNETVLASFVDGGKAVFKPSARVIIDNGVLLGALEYGGYPNCDQVPSPGCGGLYSVTLHTPPVGATVDVLYKFSPAGYDTDAQNPTTAMVLGLSGILYGSTYQGGSSNLGAMFSFTPPTSPGGSWTEALLHSFTGVGTDGSRPEGVVSDPGSGVIYGSTGYGGTSNSGTVYSFTP